MKRKAGSPVRCPKGSKTARLDRASSVSYDPSLERRWSDIGPAFQDGAEQRGWIAGKVHMTWPPINLKTLKMVLVTEEELEKGQKQSTLMPVEFRGEAVKYLTIKIHDELQLSLKGARIEPKRSSSSPHDLPFTLVYDDGAAIKLVSRLRKPEDAGMTVDVWQRAS